MQFLIPLEPDRAIRCRRRIPKQQHLGRLRSFPPSFSENYGEKAVKAAEGSSMRNQKKSPVYAVSFQT
jgi:hypothetical protein